MAYAKQGTEGKTRLERMQDTVRDFGKFLYSRNEDNEVLIMGRNGSSWAKLAVFFLIFYGCLAGFFAAMLSVFMTTVPDKADGPKFTKFIAGKQGLIPTPLEVKSGYDHVKAINDFLEPYEKAMGSDSYNHNCTEENREKGSKPCAMNLTTLGECYNSNKTDFDYGYKEGKPCIFFKMNKVYGWVPEPNPKLDYVELKCRFEDNDKTKDLHPFPSDKPGFLANFYPFLSEDKWLSPIAALKINITTSGVILCEASAQNIKLSDTYRLNRGATGRVRIEVDL
ncbi:positive regulation of calcium:sodium antiporter [Porites harrisoni]